MTLSEAIRLGAMLKPQGYGRLWKDGASCAMGAAADALGIAVSTVITGGIPIIYDRHWPAEWGLRAFVANPVNGEQSRLGDAIRWLNDRPNCWTRERIADWVEQIEAQHAPQPEVGKQNLTEALR